jgi:hypothetical protein
MPQPPLLLVSCTRCRVLHAPLRGDAAHPLCGRCTAPHAADGAPRPGARRR